MTEFIQQIRPINLGTILHLAGMNVGERRAIRTIVAVAEEFCADVPTVAAAFLFGRDTVAPHQYRDYLRDSEFDPLIDSDEIRAAWELGWVAFTSGVPTEGDKRRASADRIVGNIRTLSQTQRSTASRHAAGRPHHGQRLFKKTNPV
jgi:hypothetical protein